MQLQVVVAEISIPGLQYMVLLLSGSSLDIKSLSLFVKTYLNWNFVLTGFSSAPDL
jgi:hypothetical protein